MSKEPIHPLQAVLQAMVNDFWAAWPKQRAQADAIIDAQFRQILANEPEIPILQPIARRTITPDEALRDRCAELETCIRMAIRAFNGDLAPAIAEAACRDALL